MNETAVKRGGRGTTRWWLVIALALGMALPVIACTDAVDDPDPPTGETEQGLTTCDYDYFDGAGNQIGFCYVPCGGPRRCTGIIPPDPRVKHIEFSCTTCFGGTP
jgi:hypothetical protein